MEKGSVGLLSITAIAAILIAIVVLVGCTRNETPPRPVSTVDQIAEDINQKSNPTEDVTPSHSQGEPTQRPLRVQAAGEWDIVVLGQVDACYVCQRGSPYVSYTQVLAGKVPNGQTEGILAVSGVAQHLFGEGGVPIYKSQQEEIVFLKRVVVPGYEDKDIYAVVDVMKATPENLALFDGQ